MSSAEPPEHEIWNEEAESPDGVGELRPQRPVEEGAEYRPSGATKSAQGAEHTGHNALGQNVKMLKLDFIVCCVFTF